MRVGAKALVAACAAIAVMNVFAAGSSSATTAATAAHASTHVVPNTPPLADGTRFHENGGSTEYISWFGASLPLSSGDAKSYSAEGNKAVSTVAAGYVAAHPASDFPAHKAFRIVGSVAEYLFDGEEILPLSSTASTCLTNIAQAQIAVVPDLWARSLTIGPSSPCVKPTAEGPFTFLQSFSPPANVDGFGFSFPGDTFTGDFNGDGRADELIYGEGQGPSQLWYGTANGFELGPPITVNGQYEPVVGDFNGDGRDDILWYSIDEFGGPTFPTSIWYGRPGNAGFLAGPKLPAPPQGVNKTITIRKNDTYSFNTANYEPYVGDFNGDGKADVYWFDTDATGTDTTGTPIAPNQIWYGATLGFIAGSKSLTPYPPDRHTQNLPDGSHITDYFFAEPPFIGDFNGDGKADILWYIGGFTRLWRGTNGAFTNATIPTVYGTYQPFVGDFNGDGKADVIWYAPGPAADSYWLGTAGGFTPGPHININGQYQPFVGDFNGDGRDDIYWDGFTIDTRSPSIVKGTDYVWFGKVSGFNPSAGIKPAAPTTSIFGLDFPSIGDFNGDGHDDMLWWHQLLDSNGFPDNQIADLWRAH